MTEVQKWADEAMFKSEPLVAADGPKVYLLEMSSDPLGQIAAACKMYKGEVVRSLADITDEERRSYLAQVQKTKLKAPFEFVKFHFLFEGVTRAFTHQLVRQRTAAYAQESLRFAVKEDMADGVALPPSLLGSRPWDDWTPAEQDGLVTVTKQDHQRVLWDRAVDEIDSVYTELVNSGMPAEDARGLLPHNITTRVHYTTDLRALQDHAGNRLCTQAQFEWRGVWAQILIAIRNYEAPNGDNDWQYQELAKIFKPVCYLTGHCEFGAEFDRKCSIRPRVQLNAEHGVPSAAWEGDHSITENGQTVFIPAIHTREWAGDPNAAR